MAPTDPAPVVPNCATGTRLLPKLDETCKFLLGVGVPIPTAPSIIAPFRGAAVVPEYVAPTASPPSTSNLLAGADVPIPVLPVEPMKNRSLVPSPVELLLITKALAEASAPIE